MSGNGTTRLKQLCEDLEAETLQVLSVLFEIGRMAGEAIAHDVADDAMEADVLRTLHDMTEPLGNLAETLIATHLPIVGDRIAEIQGLHQTAYHKLTDVVTIDYAKRDGEEIQNAVIERLQKVQRTVEQVRELRKDITEATS